MCDLTVEIDRGSGGVNSKIWSDDSKPMVVKRGIKSRPVADEKKEELR